MASAPPPQTKQAKRRAPPDAPGRDADRKADRNDRFMLRMAMLLPLLALILAGVAGHALGPIGTGAQDGKAASIVVINRAFGDPEAADAIAAALGGDVQVSDIAASDAVPPALRLGDADWLIGPETARPVLQVNTVLPGAGFDLDDTAGADAGVPPEPIIIPAPDPPPAAPSKDAPQTQQQAPAQSQRTLGAPTGVPVPPPDRLYATTPEILAAGLAAAWLRADAAGAMELEVLHLELSGAPAALPFEHIEAALRLATDMVAPHLTGLRTVQVRDVDLLPNRQGQARGVPDLWFSVALEAPLADPPAWRLPLDALAVALPPPGLAAALTPQPGPADTSPVRADGTLAPGWINPIAAVLAEGPRRSWTPVVAFLAALYLGAAVLLRASRGAPAARRRVSVLGLAGTAAAAGVGLGLGRGGDWAALTGSAAGDGVVPALALAFALVGVTPALAAPLFARVSARRAPDAVADDPERDRDRALRAVLHSDLPTTDDALGFGRIADALAEFLDHRNTRPPVVLAVNGPWGSGKSSIMKMVQARLEPTRRFNVVWFNAWRYRARDEILQAFLATMSNHLTDRWTPLAALRLAWARLRRASLGQLMALTVPAAVLGAALAALLVPDAAPLAEALARLPMSGGAADAVAAPLAALGAGGLLRYLLPFRRPILRLFSLNPARRQMSLEDFEREFALYREAIGRRKVLVVVDDLDRCEPDSVVEVLRSINLIVSSTERGDSATYFLLGFDAEYIVRSIDLHFDKHAELAGQRGDSFGRQYLKKIVTLGVSVPQPEPEALANLAARAAERAGRGAAPAGWPARLRDGLAAHRGLLQNLSLCAAAAAGLLLSALHLATPVPAPEPAPAADAIAQPSGAAAEAETAPAGSDGGLRAVRLPPETLAPDAPDMGASGDIAGGLAWALLLGGVGGALLLYLLGRVDTLAAPVPAEPDDSPAFDAAVRRHAGLLPGNPRDLIRTLNLMRVIQRIQGPDDRGRDGPAAPALFAGPPMPADSVVVLTALQQRFPQLLSTETLAERLVPAAERAAAGPDLFADLDDPRRAELTALLAQRPDTWQALTRDSLARFLQVSRNILQTGTLTPTSAAPEPPPPRAAANGAGSAPPP